MANETILIVEDEGIIAAQLQNTLTGLGYTVRGPVNSGEAALAAVMAQPPDLVLMDIKLAGAMDGIAAAGRIRSAADIPIVYLTGYSQELMFQQAKVTAPYGFLVKPVHERELAVTLEIALYRHSFDRRLRESEEKYRGIIEQSLDGVVFSDEQGNINIWNSSMELITGLNRCHTIGLPLWKVQSQLVPDELRTPELIDRLKTAIGNILESKIDWPGESREQAIISADGTHKVVQDNSFIVKINNAVRIGSILRDITKRKQVDDALRRSEENFRRSLDESPLGVRIITAKGETIYANRVLLDFYGYGSIAEINQIPLRERYTPKSYGEYKKRRKIREGGKFGPGEYEISIVRKDGEVRELQVFRKAILWNDENQFQAFYRDISESKHWLEKFGKFEKTIQGQKMLLDQQSSSVEELIERLTRSREELGASYRELKAQKDDLVRSEKLAFTGRMAAGIAHEVRNPLTNIILSVRQINKDETITMEVRNYVDIMERNANRIECLIEELLNCARPVKLDLQPGDIHLLLNDILNIHKVRLKTQKITVIKKLAARLPGLRFDKEQLGRVFLNLIANAIDAMPPGGSLTIATKHVKKKIVIKFQDSGSGIQAVNLIRIFDPFFSTKKKGMGLGLSTCQNIVISHGGLIEVESVWKKGSIFSVSLPLEPKPLEGKGNTPGNP